MRRLSVILASLALVAGLAYAGMYLSGKSLPDGQDECAPSCTHTSTEGEEGCGCGCSGSRPSVNEAGEKASSVKPAPCDTSEEIPSEGEQCGPLALEGVCRALGVKTTSEELARLSDTDAGGTTMLGLAKAARAKGLQARGVKITFDELQRMPKPLIVWIDRGHFTAVEECSKDKVRFSPPPGGEPASLSAADFRKRWEGHALLVTR